jgi:hypothetical protein
VNKQAELLRHGIFGLFSFILSVLRIRIRYPGLGAFLTPGSGIRDGRKSASGSGITRIIFLELRNHFFAFFGVKILKFFDEDPGSGITYLFCNRWITYLFCNRWRTPSWASCTVAAEGAHLSVRTLYKKGQSRL